MRTGESGQVNEAEAAGRSREHTWPQPSLACGKRKRPAIGNGRCFRSRSPNATEPPISHARSRRISSPFWGVHDVTAEGFSVSALTRI